MKFLNAAKKYGFAIAVTSMAAPTFAAEGASQVSSYFSAIDLSGVATAVGAAGVTIVGITMAYKGITLAKRAVNKA